LEDLDVNGRIVLEWFLEKEGGKDRSCCEHGNEPPVSVKGGELLD
jgi:hypothetical protein